MPSAPDDTDSNTTAVGTRTAALDLGDTRTTALDTRTAALDLVDKLLAYPETERLRPKDALKQPWFRSSPILLPPDFPEDLVRKHLGDDIQMTHEFGEKTLENRKIALEKSPSVARFNDVCAECSYCGVIVYFTAGGSYAIEYLMDHLKAVHGGLSIGFRGEVSAPGVATAHALTGNAPLVASNDFVRKYGNAFLEGAGRRSAAAAHLLDFAAQASDSLFPSVSHIDML